MTPIANLDRICTRLAEGPGDIPAGVRYLSAESFGASVRLSNREHPERGGALKSRAFHGREWVEKARETLAGSINEKLSALGRDERVDHRSFTRQGIDREPGEHFGPSAAHMVERGSQHDRLEDAAEARDHPERLTEVEEQIARLEALRDVLANQADTPDLEPDTRYEGAYSGGYSREDDSRGRCLDAAEQRVNIHIAGRILAHGRTLTRGRPERDTPRPIRAR